MSDQYSEKHEAVLQGIKSENDSNELFVRESSLKREVDTDDTGDSTPKKIKIQHDGEKLAYGGNPVVPYTEGSYIYTRHEEMPDLEVNRYYHRQALENFPLIIKGSVLPTIDSYAGEDRELDDFIKWFMIHAQAPPSVPIQIALVGDSGSGKSFTLNNLSGELGLANSGSSMGSVTQVPQVFAHGYSQERFHVRVYFSRKRTVGILLRNCVVALQKYVNSDDDAEDQEADIIRAEAEAARQVLDDLFTHQNGLSSLDDAEDFLTEKAVLGAVDDKKSGLGQLTDEVFERAVAEGLDFSNSSTTFTADNLGELHAKVRVFSERGGLAPIVTHIRTCFPSPLLEQGIEIADLPGFSDTNLHLMKNTMDYFSNCSRALLVAPLERATTNSGLDKLLKDVIRRKGAENVCLVLRGKENTENGIKLKGTEQSTLNTITEELKQAKRRLGEAQTEGSFDDPVVLEAEKVVANLERKLKEHRISIRDRALTEHFLQKKYRDRRGDGVLTIITVSNTDYDKYVMGKPGATISVEATGIKQLRSFVCVGPSEVRVRAFHHHQMMALRKLQRLLVWAELPRFNRRDEVMALFASRGKVNVDKYQSDLFRIAKHMQGSVMQLISASWEDTLKVTIDNWSKYAPTTQGTFYKRGGRHTAAYKSVKGQSSQPKKFVSWTGELLESVSDNIIQAEKKCFPGKIVECEAAINEDVSRELEYLRLGLEGQEAVGGTDLESTFEMFKKEGDACIQDITDSREQLMSSISKAILEATTDEPYDEDDSPVVVKELHKLYIATFNKFPKGTKKVGQARIDYFQEQIRRPGGPFNKMAEEILAKLKTIFKDWIEEINKRIAELFKDLHDVLFKSFDGKRMAVERKAEVRPKIREVVEKAILAIKADLASYPDSNL